MIDGETTTLTSAPTPVSSSAATSSAALYGGGATGQLAHEESAAKQRPQPNSPRNGRPRKRKDWLPGENATDDHEEGGRTHSGSSAGTTTTASVTAAARAEAESAIAQVESYVNQAMPGLWAYGNLTNYFLENFDLPTILGHAKSGALGMICVQGLSAFQQSAGSAGGPPARVRSAVANALAARGVIPLRGTTITNQASRVDTSGGGANAVARTNVPAPPALDIFTSPVAGADGRRRRTASGSAFKAGTALHDSDGAAVWIPQRTSPSSPSQQASSVNCPQIDLEDIVLLTNKRRPGEIITAVPNKVCSPRRRQRAGTEGQHMILSAAAGGAGRIDGSRLRGSSVHLLDSRPAWMRNPTLDIHRLADGNPRHQPPTYYVQWNLLGARRALNARKLMRVVSPLLALNSSGRSKNAGVSGLHMMLNFAPALAVNPTTMTISVSIPEPCEVQYRVFEGDRIVSEQSRTHDFSQAPWSTPEVVRLPPGYPQHSIITVGVVIDKVLRSGAAGTPTQAGADRSSMYRPGQPQLSTPTRREEVAAAAGSPSLAAVSYAGDEAFPSETEAAAAAMRSAYLLHSQQQLPSQQPSPSNDSLPHAAGAGAAATYLVSSPPPTSSADSSGCHPARPYDDCKLADALPSVGNLLSEIGPVAAGVAPARLDCCRAVLSPRKRPDGVLQPSASLAIMLDTFASDGVSNSLLMDPMLAAPARAQPDYPCPPAAPGRAASPTPTLGVFLGRDTGGPAGPVPMAAPPPATSYYPAEAPAPAADEQKLLIEAVTELLAEDNSFAAAAAAILLDPAAALTSNQ